MNCWAVLQVKHLDAGAKFAQNLGWVHPGGLGPVDIEFEEEIEWEELMQELVRKDPIDAFVFPPMIVEPKVQATDSCIVECLDILIRQTAEAVEGIASRIPWPTMPDHTSCSKLPGEIEHFIPSITQGKIGVRGGDLQPLSVEDSFEL